MPTGWKKQSTSTPETGKMENNFGFDTPKQETSETTEMNRMEMFIPETPQRAIEDLIVPPNVRSRIETALNRIRYHDVLYYQWNLKKIDPQGRRVAINMYGLPGTGKTFCAEAIAHHLNKPIIKVNYAEIESKYVGDTPKNITAAFKKARETNAVLFFDEADSILGKRLTNVTQSADHGVNVSRSVMLLELDKFDGVVIFATNLPGNYDGAFVRRILAHIEFELPDQPCRVQLWQFLLPDEVPCKSDVTVEWLAQESEGLAGGDILNVVKLAASQAVSRTGENQKVMQSDIQEAIAQVRSGKEKVGASNHTIVKEEIVTPDKLPPQVQAEYNKAVSQLDSPALVTNTADN
jgi:SpoVK/Ycf46/Vps4 family AAA+-type ATPase